MPFLLSLIIRYKRLTIFRIFKILADKFNPERPHLKSMDYLLAFAAHDFINFRELEIRSLLTIHGLSQDCIPSSTNWTDPYVKIRLPNNEVAAAFIERSMLVKSIYLIWTCASSFEELLEMVLLSLLL